VRYRKKPVVIEAMQFTTNNEAGGAPTMDRIVLWANQGQPEMRAWHNGTDIFIPTLEGEMRAVVGDWIIRGVQGEFYPCKPDIFEATYEPVDGALGTALIRHERQRQVEAEGWTAEHDDEHVASELSRAAVAYIREDRDLWPWEPESFKPSETRIPDLVKAGALIAAEIDRLARAEPLSLSPQQ
jgi:hypothetical protein